MAQPEPLENSPAEETQAPEPAAAMPSSTELAGIGRDDPTPQPEPEEEKPSEEEPAEAPMTPEQIADLQEKASAYEWITHQPDLMQNMADFLKQKNTPQQKAASEDVSLERRVEQLQQNQAQLVNELEVTQFLLRNPVLQKDPDTLKEWGGLVQKGLSKEDALDLVKRQQELRQAQQPRTSRLVGSEGGHVGGGERRVQKSKWDKQIAGARTAGDAVEAAFQAVLEERSAQD